jgi:signal peptidase I
LKPGSVRLESPTYVSKSSLQSVVRLGVGVGIVAILCHTWFLLGLVVPVTVAGSSMAPALEGPHATYRCATCQEVFSLGLDLGAPELAAACPKCGRLVERAESVDVTGDRLLVDRTAFLLRRPRRWEVVVFRSPVEGASLVVKRVVGLPGEMVAIVGGDLLVDGVRIEPPGDLPCPLRFGLRYGDHDKLRDGWRLGPNEYFVLGDNAEISDDSRNWATGPCLDAKLLVGRPLGVR